MIYEKVKQEYDKLSINIEEIENKLRSMPRGTLQCIQDGKYHKWYQCDNGTRRYISNKNRELAEQLAFKKILTDQLSNLKQEKTAIEFYLRHHKPIQEHEITNQRSPYRELLQSYIKPTNIRHQEWMREDYPKNEKYPEHLIYKSTSGNTVRSKSELLIDMMLHINKIPFRYECALQLEEIVLFPDFTIMHPMTEEIFYWEHFGRMDEPGYCKNACSKIRLYTANDIIPTVNLIMTFETKDHPLNTEKIENIIREYFL